MRKITTFTAIDLFKNCIFIKNVLDYFFNFFFLYHIIQNAQITIPENN